MKRLILSAVVAGLVMTGISAALPVQTRPQPTFAGAGASDKYDGDCTGHETTGRCADKCPANTSEGAYHLQGYDDETGAAICGFTYYNECPYAAGYSATDPMCDKFAAQQQKSVTPAQPQAAQCGGK